MIEPKLARLLKYIVYATAFVPLIIFSQFISPFHFGKVVIFRSLVEIAAVLYILLVWRDRAYLPKLNPIFWSFLAFVGVFTLTTATSVHFYESFWGTLERMGGLFTFWHYFAYFVILTSVMRTEKDWFRLFELAIFVGVLSAFYGFLQKTDWSWIVGSGDRVRIFGTIGNAALFAGYQVVNMFLATTLYFRSQNSYRQKNFFAIAVAISFIAVMMTAVRGSILGVGVGLLVFVFLYAGTLNSKMAKKALISLIIFAALFVGFAQTMRDSGFVKNSGYLSRLTDFSLKTFTVQTRFWAWQAGIDGWNDSVKTILVGWGPENFNVPFSVHFNPKFYKGPGAETLFDRAHNMFVEVLVTMGLAGFIAYVSIFAAAFWSLRKINKNKDNEMSQTNNKAQILNTQKENQVLRIGLTALLIAYMIHNAFIFDTSANFIVFFTVLGFISWLTPKRDTDNTNQHPNTVNIRRSGGALFKLVGVAMFVFVAILAYQTNIIPTKANFTATRGIIAGWNNDFNRASEKFREAINYNSFGKYEIRHRYAQYLFEYSAGREITPALQGEIDWNIGKVEELIEDRPMDYLPRLYVSRMNIILGKKEGVDSSYNDEALKYALEALDISPTFVRTYYEVAQAYLNQEKYEKAIEYFQKAAELNPDVGQSYWYLGITEIQSGDTNKGLQTIKLAMEKGYGPDESDLARLINIYVSLKDFKQVVALYERLVAVAPHNAQYRASLATAYLRVGRIDDAVAQAREAVKIDPSFEAEARAFVNSLGRIW